MTIDAMFTHFPVLETERLLLRQIQQEDAEALFATFSDDEVNRAFWRQGIMTEAMSAILTYAFSELGLHRIEAVVDDVNEHSKGLLLKLGFTHEGTLRKRFYFRERFWDEHYFGLLSDEWSGLA